MSNLTDFGMDVPTEESASSGSHYTTRDCRAITLSKGKQCTSSASNSDMLCRTHQESHRVRRVDEFDTGPNPQFRDALITQCGLPGTQAYALATIFDNPHELWTHILEEKQLDVGDETLDKDALVSLGPNIAQHPALNVDDHLYAQDRCIALTQKQERCPNGAYNKERICGLHKDTDDIELMEAFSQNC